MNFGFNDAAEHHIHDTDAVRGLRPNFLRVSGDNMDEAARVIAATNLRGIIVVGTFSLDPSHVAALAAEVLQRMPGSKAQIMNEPNSPDFANAPSDAVRRVLRACVDRCGPENIIGPCMSPGVQGWEDYMRSAYMDTGCRHAAINLYPYTKTGFDAAIVNAFFTASMCAPNVHVTEAGCQRSRFGDQAKWTKRLYRSAKHLGARTYIAHRLSEPVPASEWEKQARLWVINSDGTRTGLYGAYAEVRA